MKFPLRTERVPSYWLRSDHWLRSEFRKLRA